MGGSDEPTERGGRSESGVSRRQFVAGNVLLVGGSSLAVDAETQAAFTDAVSARGSVRIDGDPTLNYRIQDQSRNNNAEYEIYYQVEWVANYDSIEIQVENVDDANIAGETFTRTSTEGSISYPSGGGSDGGAADDTYRFTFRVYKTGNSAPIIEKTTEDQADGASTGDGDFGNANSPALEWALVEDNTKNNNGNYIVYYEIENAANFSRLVATFEDTQKSSATTTPSSPDSPNGKVTYSKGGVEGHQFDITLEVKNQNGLTVDAVMIDDVADGTNPSSYGDPVRSDSPKLDSFTITDGTQNNTTNYTLSYQTVDTSRFGGTRIIFEDTVKSSTETFTNGSGATSGSMSYSEGGTGGHRYKITVEVLETRNGITFPIDTGSVTDDSGGDGKTWPEDA